MIFNSFVFIAFFAITYSIYRVLPHLWQNRMLLLASYVFYGWWDWRFLGLIIVSTIVDYFAGIAIHNSDRVYFRRRYLIVSLCTNLGILGFFKYANFFVDSFSDGLSFLGLDLDNQIASIVLPVGISFYTFQTMSYTIDIYRKQLSPTKNFWDFALFVAYFPQLVAGPIERARVLLPQLTTKRTISFRQIEEGCWLILSGYYLKCVLADNLGPFVDIVFQSPESANGMMVLVGVWAAAFQIYGDFAGYSRIAIGLSKLMGIDLMQNFNRPYLAISPSDFWSRWHISLSTWLRDYLYISLGGNRGSSLKTYRNLMLTMLLGGLWHGAAWNFVIWGLFHGVILCVWRMASPIQPNPIKHNSRGNIYSHVLKILFFFQLTCLGWLLFFVYDLNDVWVLISNCISNWEWNGRLGLISLVLFAMPVIVLEVIGEVRKQNYPVLELSKPYRLAIYMVLAFSIVFSGSVELRQFIYFQF